MELRAVITSAFELLILTALMHRLVLIFRSGRATPILTTLVVLALVYYIAEQWNLRVIVWLFQELAPILGIIIVIVFQPEIRRALERSGNLGAVITGVRGRSEETVHLIDLLMKVLEDFAERRVGALILLEQRSNLDSFVETGERLDARASTDLLESIFHHQSPLHDGAVIMRGNRALAARCFLPLSDNPDLPPHFGTRHRAALGISEVTDAIVLVVSEESGRMSLVHLGRVAEDLSPVAMRYQLASLLMPNAAVASRLPELDERDRPERPARVEVIEEAE